MAFAAYSKARDLSNIFGIGNATISPTKEVAKKRVFKLYRSTLRTVPEIIALYEIGYSTKQVQFAIRQAFEKNKNVVDKSQIDFLTFVGENELLETIKVWKQKGHLSKYLEPLRPKKTESYFDNLLERIRNPSVNAEKSKFYVEGMSQTATPRRY